MAYGLGEDIKEVYTELGSLATIVNRTPEIENERVIYEINAQATKPFIREHHLDATFPYDTQIETGDVLFIEEMAKYYMAMNKTAEMFENSKVEWNVVLYLCNLPTTACFLRPIEIRNPISYDMVSGWQVFAPPPVYGLLTDRIYGTNLEQGEIVGQVPLWRIDCYLPKWYGLKPLDRVFVSSTEYYKVESVENYNYPGVVVALMTEDTRPYVNVVDGEIYDG